MDTHGINGDGEAKKLICTESIDEKEIITHAASKL